MRLSTSLFPLAVLIGLGGLSHCCADTGLAQVGGKPVPGSFQTLSVNGPRPQKYYCPVCESGLYPGVVVFFPKPEEASKPLPALLKQIDEVLARYPDARMNACAICLDDGGYRKALASDGETPDQKTLDAAITQKEGVEGRLKEEAQTLGLKKVAFAIGMDPAAQKEYEIAADAYATVIVYSRQHVLATFRFTDEKVDETEAAKLLKLIDTTAAASQKQAEPKRRKLR
jgi:hypothetical protein